MSRSGTLATWWQDLQARERTALLLMLTVLVLFLLWLLLWRPVSQQQTVTASALEVAQADLVWMKTAQSALATSPATAVEARAQRGSQSLLALVESSARAANLADAFRRGEPDGSTRVRIWMEQANFDALVQWLQGLSTNYGIVALEADVSQLDLPGLVDARVLLSEP